MYLRSLAFDRRLTTPSLRNDAMSPEVPTTDAADSDELVPVKAPKEKKAKAKDKAKEKETPKANKAPKDKKAPKEKATPEAAEKEVPKEITDSQMKVLKALRKTSAENTMTRAQLREVTGIQVGYCKMIGSSTVEGGGRGAGTGLEPRGLVKSLSVPEVRGLSYHITAKGLKLLAKGE